MKTHLAVHATCKKLATAMNVLVGSQGRRHGMPVDQFVIEIFDSSTLMDVPR